MGQDLYKWDEGGVLKHHCPICAQPLSHEKCRTTCLGKHVEWCHRYHSLFRMTWATRCAACKTCDEQHEKRHRDIAEILHRIKKIKAEEEAMSMEMLMSPTTPKTPSCRTPLTAKALGTIDGPMTPGDGTPKMSRKDRKAAKKVAKAMDRDKVITTADILLVAKTLHPEPEKDASKADAEAEAMAEDEEIKRNLRFNYSTCNSKSIRQSYIDKERGQNQVQDVDITGILEQFEVNVNAIGKEGELVEGLIKAIKSDLLHFHEEVESTARNKAGFWRWANKKHYRALMDRGKDWDDKHKPMENGEADIAEERRDSAFPSDPEGEDEASPTSSRRGSVGVPSLSHSAGTISDSVLTVPSSSKVSLSTKKSPVLSLSIPGSISGNSMKATKGSSVGDPGWTQVGKKVLKAPPRGKITLAGNGGLQHLHVQPKGKFGALSWADAAKSD